MPDFDPLAAMHSRLAGIYDDGTPPDATGDADAITDLSKLDRYESEPGAVWTIDPGPAQMPVTEQIKGGLHPLPPRPEGDDR